MSEVRLYEDKEKQNGYVNIDELMTPTQQERGRHYQDEYYQRRAEVDERYKTLWDALHDLYECRRAPDADDPDYPNSMIPIITPCVEGQVASMSEANIDFAHVTDNPGHRSWMIKYDAASEYYRKKTRFNAQFKDFMRWYDLEGNAYVAPCWQKSFGNTKNKPSGLPRIKVPTTLSILIDGRIKDAKDLQYADYIIEEVGYQTIKWARKEFGDKYADAISIGLTRDEGNDPDISLDDTDTWMYLRVWTRDNEFGNLQLIEMDADGLILKESDPSKPYYKYVDNQYPFFLARMIPQNGKLYGIGDGVILKPIQETINNLTDEVEIAARFSAQARTFIDNQAKIDGNALTSNPADPVFGDDVQHNILVTQGAGINPVVMAMIQYLEQKAQAATRFNEIMTGNQQGTSATATQINNQMIQGSVGIKDKKTDIAEAMAWADWYCLKLCMQFCDKSFWANMGTNYSEYVDMQDLEQVPAMVPTSTATIDKAISEAEEFGTEPNVPEYEEAKENGKTIMTEIDFDSKVVIGEGMPKGKTDTYNMLVNLAGIVMQNEDGTTEPIISADCLREKLEQLLGFHLMTEKEKQEGLRKQMQSVVPQSVTGQNPVAQGGAVQMPQMPPENMASIPGLPGTDMRNKV